MRITFYRFADDTRLGAVWYDDDGAMQSDAPYYLGRNWEHWPYWLFYARYSRYCNGYIYSRTEPDLPMWRGII